MIEIRIFKIKLIFMGMADIHQLSYNNSNHRGELVQPSLVINHNHINSGCLGERDVHGNFISKFSIDLFFTHFWRVFQFLLPFWLH